MAISDQQLKAFNVCNYLKTKSIRFDDNEGRQYLILDECPNCKREKKCIVNKEKGFWNCFSAKCRASGSLADLLMLIESIDYREAYRRIVGNVFYADKIEYNELETIEHKKPERLQPEIEMPFYWQEIAF